MFALTFLKGSADIMKSQIKIFVALICPLGQNGKWFFIEVRMRHTSTIFKWEMSKIIGNWRKTMTVFLLPALLLLAAINVFPLLMNYMTTGSLQSRPVTVIGAPDSFVDFVDSNKKASFYSFTWYDEDEAVELGPKYFSDLMEKGRIVVCFGAAENNERTDFDDVIEEYYQRLALGQSTRTLFSRVEIFYDGQYSNYLQAEQFKQDLGDDYSDYLMEELGTPYLEAGGGDRWSVDDFNPFTFVTRNRATANNGAARTIPSMMILLMYYCIYSLTAETLASQRQNGFLTKVYLSPISKQAIITGKALMVIFVGMVGAVVTYLLMFFSSWLNRSNSAYSLLPFGLFLTLPQLLMFFIALLFAAVIMAMVCFGITFKIRRMQDVIMNLQVPLVLLIVEFFGNMFRPSDALLAEYLIPIHNSIMLIRDIFLGKETVGNFIIVSSINLLVAALLFAACIRSQDGMIHISEGGQDDFGKPRK